MWVAGERDVLVRPHVTGDEGLREHSGCLEPAHERHLAAPLRRCRGRRARGRIAVAAAAWPVVGEPSVDRPSRSHSSRSVGPAVDAEAVDVARDRVDLLPRLGPRPVPGAAGVRVNAIEPRVFVKSSSGSVAPKAIGAFSPPDLLAQAERVVHELPPDEAPLGDAVLREQVLADVVEDPVADVPGRRPADRLRDPVGVVRRATRSTGCSSYPSRVAAVVAASVQRSISSAMSAPATGVEHQERSQQENDLAHVDTSSKGRPQA